MSYLNLDTLIAVKELDITTHKCQNIVVKVLIDVWFTATVVVEGLKGFCKPKYAGASLPFFQCGMTEKVPGIPSMWMQHVDLYIHTCPLYSGSGTTEVTTSRR
ncbi:hypothetical protein J6590_055238 [Homalodisca vitripennis]|nr:hypothetical protein J6590_055238 [Homalodisca vitripennis]